MTAGLDAIVARIAGIRVPDAVQRERSHRVRAFARPDDRLRGAPLLRDLSKLGVRNDPGLYVGAFPLPSLPRKRVASGGG